MLDTRDLLDEISTLDPEDADDAERRQSIDALFEDITQYAEDRPEDGIFLIRDDYFVDYAERLADDIGAIDRNAGWPLSHIDWQAAANDLKQDYTSVEFEGSTWWYR